MHPLHSPDIFYAGDWRLAPDENAWHLNGVVLLRREHFEGAAGYDERMRRCDHPPAGTSASHTVHDARTAIVSRCALTAAAFRILGVADGWDDTDLYFRLTSALNLSRRCINYSLIHHRSDGHAYRGQT